MTQSGTPSPHGALYKRRRTRPWLMNRVICHQFLEGVIFHSIFDSKWMPKGSSRSPPRLDCTDISIGIRAALLSVLRYGSQQATISVSRRFDFNFRRRASDWHSSDRRETRFIGIQILATQTSVSGLAALSSGWDICIRHGSDTGKDMSENGTVSCGVAGRRELSTKVQSDVSFGENSRGICAHQWWGHVSIEGVMDVWCVDMFRLNTA